jgi:HSP20 family protein
VPAESPGVQQPLIAQEVETMLMRTDPFRELDRLAQQVLGTTARPAVMPMDAWREGDEFVVQFDLPGVTAESVDLDVDGNVLTVKAERRLPTGEDIELVASERPRGVFSRQLLLGDNVDTEHVQASYDAGVLTLKIPIEEKAKPRKIEIASAPTDRQEIQA